MQTTFETILLLLSHLALIPAISLTFILKQYDNLGFLVVLFFESTFYHICQGEIFCVIDSFDVHQKADHFFVYSTLFWFILYSFDIELKTRVFIWIILIGLLFPFLTFYFHSTWFGIGILVGVLILFLFITGVVIKRLPKIRNCTAFILLIVFLLIGFAFFVFAGEPGEEGYPIIHSIWHICVMIAIFFLIETKERKKAFMLNLSENRDYYDDNQITITTTKQKRKRETDYLLLDVIDSPKDKNNNEIDKEEFYVNAFLFNGNGNGNVSENQPKKSLSSRNKKNSNSNSKNTNENNKTTSSKKLVNSLKIFDIEDSSDEDEKRSKKIKK